MIGRDLTGKEISGPRKEEAICRENVEIIDPGRWKEGVITGQWKDETITGLRKDGTITGQQKDETITGLWKGVIITDLWKEETQCRESNEIIGHHMNEEIQCRGSGGNMCDPRIEESLCRLVTEEIHSKEMLFMCGQEKQLEEKVDDNFLIAKVNGRHIPKLVSCFSPNSKSS